MTEQKRLRPQEVRILQQRLSGMTFRQIADELGCTYAAARDRWLYARRKLRNQDYSDERKNWPDDLVWG